MSSPPDREVVAAILAGSREDFDRLYEDLFPRVYAYTLRCMGDPYAAQQATRDVLTLVFESLPGFAEGSERLLPWVFRITRDRVDALLRGETPSRRPHPRRAAPAPAGGAAPSAG